MITLLWTDSEGDDECWEFPHKNILCLECEGEGTVETGGSYGDPIFNMKCDCCNGVRVVKLVDEEKFDDEDRAMYADYKAAKKRHESYRSEERFAQDYS